MFPVAERRSTVVTSSSSLEMRRTTNVPRAKGSCISSFPRSKSLPCSIAIADPIPFRPLLGWDEEEEEADANAFPLQSPRSLFFFFFF